MSFYNLNETSPTATQPKGLKIKLRPHQLTAYRAMRDMEKDASIIINNPKVERTPYGGMKPGLFTMLRYKIDEHEFTDSTFIIGTNSAIQADKVGSGKTYILYSVIVGNKVPELHDRYLIGTDYYSIKMISARESEKINLIVVPHNLASQWYEFSKNTNLKCLKLNSSRDFDILFDVEYTDVWEIGKPGSYVIYNHSKKKLPELDPTKIGKMSAPPSTAPKVPPAGRKPAEKQIYEKKTLNHKKVADVLKEYDVIILNINRYTVFKRIFAARKWARVVIDEMDSIKIPSTFNEYGNFNWYLTATPTSINGQGRKYVSKIFDNENLLNYLTIKNSDAYVDKSVVLPRPHVYFIGTALQKVVNAIREYIPDDVLRLINAGNMKEAITRLNCDVDTAENIVDVLTSKIKTELHNFKAEYNYLENVIPANVEQHENKLKKLKEEINRRETRLESIKEKIDSIKNECCFICADNYDNPTILECCKNIFCFKCLLAALKSSGNTCPYCRHQIKSSKEYHVISDKERKQADIPKAVENKHVKYATLDKSDVLEKLLCHIAKNDATPRILIFSDYPQTFDKIKQNVRNAKLEFSLLSGVPSHINNVINDYRAGKINVLMLDAQHYGSGLNLQECDYIILFHRMKPEIETQVIGRAQRFGRIKSLRIIYLINDSENNKSNMSDHPFFIKDDADLMNLTNPITDKNLDAALAAEMAMANSAYVDSDDGSDGEGITGVPKGKAPAKARARPIVRAPPKNTIQRGGKTIEYFGASDLARKLKITIGAARTLINNNAAAALVAAAAAVAVPVVVQAAVVPVVPVPARVPIFTEDDYIDEDEIPIELWYDCLGITNEDATTNKKSCDSNSESSESIQLDVIDFNSESDSEFATTIAPAPAPVPAPVPTPAHVIKAAIKAAIKPEPESESESTSESDDVMILDESEEICSSEESLELEDSEPIKTKAGKSKVATKTVKALAKAPTKATKAAKVATPATPATPAKPKVLAKTSARASSKSSRAPIKASTKTSAATNKPVAKPAGKTTGKPTGKPTSGEKRK